METKACPRGAWLSLLLGTLLACPPLLAEVEEDKLPEFCARKIRAEIIALDQVYFWNRLGAVQPQGMVYALRDDVVHSDQDESSCDTPRLNLEPGRVRLRAGKRPRPLVLRVNAGDCLQIEFQNLLSPHPEDQEQPHTRAASVHVIGLQAVHSIRDMGMEVGNNGPEGDGVVPPGGKVTYRLYAEKEGTYLMYSGGALAGGEGLSGSISAGLFGAVNVEPRGSEWYRSQVTRKELDLASVPFFRLFREHPVIDYNAVYRNRRDPDQCRRRGKPILRMLDDNDEIVHSDLTAIITGPGAGRFPAPDPPSTELYPTRDEPYREFTIIFHDEIGAVQAFPHFEQPELKFTLHSVRDAFAINYGTGGAGAEILANRLRVGPMHDCPECKYEEFFLTSWVVGDPSMVVDVPANAPCMVRTEEPQTIDQNPRFHRKVKRLRNGVDCTPRPGPKATKAFYPDDPSNVYHSYLNDRVKFRNLHAGSDDHHIFHLHAHQWTHTPASDESSYLDSQAIGQGASFTYEIAYGGGGNRNLTVGDAIFHCHFYPHFAQGMWGLWRVHDVFERGTRLDANGRPALGSRALPDGEIPRGTPIPAVVPMPTLAMAPLPGEVTIAGGQPVFPENLERNPGYPFFIPGRAGHRPPHPPLDTIHDGGLPRHVAVDGTFEEKHTRLDFSKILHELDVDWLDEKGEEVEKLAMEFHAEPGGYRTPTPRFSFFGRRIFKVNGRPAVAGAPFADPCVGEDGQPVPDEELRVYKAADIQIDAVFNKAGWHFPQQRILALWRDVEPTILNERPPEPLFIRAENGECVEYQLTNLVPSEYHVDDFQVRTPTDILGQHIHLVKFDVTSSDGSANGFNYEDGSFSPEEVRERIEAIRAANGCDETGVPLELPADPLQCPEPKLHPFFGNPGSYTNPEMKDLIKPWRGAQTTVQRWWADPIPQKKGGERSLRTVFTHDHFGPSTHQQTGLYAGLLVEPKGSSWFHNETQCPLGGRDDGGPTSWQAWIRFPDRSAGSEQGQDDKSRSEELDERRVDYREFALAFADFQLAYEPGSRECPAFQGPVECFDPRKAINPPGRKLVGPPFLYKKPFECPDESNVFAPCPEAVSADDPGTAVVNYRNEPLALRIKKPGAEEQADGQAGDLSFAYSSKVWRPDTDLEEELQEELDKEPFYPPLTRGLRPRDPFTPMMRVKEGDRVQIKVLIGAHEEEHEFTVHNIKWLAEPDDPTSGYRNAQMMGISEWFDFDIPRVPDLEDGDIADFLYKPSAASEWQWNGLWGILRVYRGGSPAQGPPPLCEDVQRIRREVPWLMSRTETRSANFMEFQADVGLQGGDLVNLDSNQDGKIAAEDEKLQINEDSLLEGLIRAEAVRDPQPATYCPVGAEPRRFEIAAVAASEAAAVSPEVRRRTLVYNGRRASVKTARKDSDPPEPETRSGPLHDPTAILFVHKEDLTCDAIGENCRLPLRPEPLILRANAGDCIEVKLTNMLPHDYEDLDGWNAVPMIIENFNANQVDPSLEVGLHPQLVSYDVRCSDGVNVGLNECESEATGKQTVSPGDTVIYHWYAGHIEVRRQPGDPDGYREELIPIPIEFGSIALSSSDPIKHTNKGAVGALIIEPAGSTWQTDPGTRASATVKLENGEIFREFVTIFQDNVNLRYADNAPVESLDINEDATESGQKAINYRTDPIWFRIGLAPDTPTTDTRNFRFYDRVLTNAFIGGAYPETPVFTAKPGEAIRFRVVHPGGHTQAHAFEVQGHLWQELPYIVGVSGKENPPVSRPMKLEQSPTSEFQGVRGGHGPTNHFDALIEKAGGEGGEGGVTGDYLYRDYPHWLFYDGVWGILRVMP